MWVVVTEREEDGEMLRFTYGLFAEKERALADAKEMSEIRERFSGGKDGPVYVYKAERLEDSEGFDERWEEKAKGLARWSMDHVLQFVVAEIVAATRTSEKPEEIAYKVEHAVELGAPVADDNPIHLELKRLLLEMGKRLKQYIYVAVGEPVAVFPEP